VAPDLLELVLKAQPGERTRVIVQSDGTLGLTFDLLLSSLGARTTRHYRNFNMRAVDLPLANVLPLALSLQVSYVSLDRPVRLLGHLSATTGADAIRAADGTSGVLLDGSGVGIAVIDSGIYADHKSFLDRSGRVRVAASRDFTGEGRTDDPYGHGTHVASVAAGNGRVSNAAYRGIAPNASLINLRVLNSRGSGSASGVLAALDWVLTNRAAYNIRIVNMSLGTAAVDSYVNDPLCQAVRRLSNAGILTVVAAGNEGKDASGRKVYGAIHSPGIEPSAVTVGAANTFGSDYRSDDGVATYSSRGPTRGYRTDARGTKHYDNLLKPDLVAPGNRIIEAEAAGNLLVTQHPELDAGVSPVPTRKMMRLSGTSMATPAVAGAAALMLQANPKLTPNLVKTILMYTAQPLADFNMFEQGTGELNVEGAVRLSRLVRTDLTPGTALGAPLLTTATSPDPQTTIAGHTFRWAQGIILNYTYATGIGLITRYQRFYGTGFLLSDGVIVGDGVITGDSRVLTDGVIVGDNIMTSAGVITGDGTFFCSSGVLYGDGANPGGGVFGDGVITGDGVIVGDGVITGDTLIRGDDTSWMEAPADNGAD
jgi:subtilisin family serine protease